MALTRWSPDDELTSARLNEMVDAFNAVDVIRDMGTDEWAVITGGVTAGAGSAIRWRAGPKYPQIGIGKMDSGTDNWVWGAVNDGTVAHFQLNQTAASQGSVNAAVFSVTSIATLAASGSLPDSSAISCFFQQANGTSGNGSGRAIEAQAIRDTDTNTDASASIFAIEAGTHSSAAGVGAPLFNKTGILNLLATSSGLTDPVELLDTGIYLHGDGGMTRPIYYFSEVTGHGANDAWYIDTVGREFVGDAGNAAAPSRSYVGDTDTGEFRAAANTLAWSCGTFEQMRISTDGLGVKRVPLANHALAVQGDSFLSSGAAGTRLELQFGRTAVEHTFAVAGGSNELIIGTAAGDGLLRAESGKKVLFGVDSAETFRFDATGLTCQKAVAMLGVISPTIAANTDNWNPTDLATARNIRVDVTGAARDLTGIVAQASGTMLTLFNISGSNNLVLKHEVTSTAANRINTPSAADYTIAPGGSGTLWYDGTSTRWRVVV